MATAAATSPARSSGFLINIDTVEKARWKRAAAAAGLTMAEYVRRAVRLADDAPTPAEVAAARQLAVEIMASAERIEATLERTQARLDDLLDPLSEQRRRAAIMARLDVDGVRLDLDALANAAR